MMIKKPVVLVVMDGVGWTEKDNGNAVLHAYKPQLDELMNKWPHRTIKASGVAVGLPSDSDMGNSEVGHNAIGSGRVFDQGAKLVEKFGAQIADMWSWYDHPKGKDSHFVFTAYAGRPDSWKHGKIINADTANLGTSYSEIFKVYR